MSDNFSVTPGTGVVIRAVDKSSIMRQVVEIDVGSGSTESLLTSGSQLVASSLPVTIAPDQSPILTKDAGFGWSVSHGISGSPVFTTNATTAIPVTDSPTSGCRIYITDIICSTDTNMWVKIQCESSSAVITGPFYLSASSVIQLTPRGIAWKCADANKRVYIKSSTSGSLMADLHYYSGA